MTTANREFVDQRLKELADQRQQLDSRLGEFDRLAASQLEITSIATDTAWFLSGLAFTLRDGFPQEQLTALRQCIDRAHIDKPGAVVEIAIGTIPAGNLDATQEIRIKLPTSSKMSKLATPAKAAKAGRTESAICNTRRHIGGTRSDLATMRPRPFQMSRVIEANSPIAFSIHALSVSAVIVTVHGAFGRDMIEHARPR